MIPALLMALLLPSAARFECEFDLITRFVTAGSPYGLDTSCVERMRRQPFVLRAD